MRYLLVLAVLCLAGCQKDIHEARAPQNINAAQMSS
jgi:hypothetical protein